LNIRRNGHPYFRLEICLRFIQQIADACQLPMVRSRSNKASISNGIQISTRASYSASQIQI